jgi:hypothetical protein
MSDVSDRYPPSPVPGPVFECTPCAPCHWVLMKISGEPIDIGGADTEIRGDTAISHVFEYAAHYADYPIDFVELCVGSRVFHFTEDEVERHRRDFPQSMYLEHIRRDMVERNELAAGSNLIIYVILRPAPIGAFVPEVPGGCICAFPNQGCCHDGLIDDQGFSCAPTHRRSMLHNCCSCGHNPVCWVGNCLHACCNRKY